MTATPRVVFRADAGPDIGLGHARRCLTLAGALRELGVESLFVFAGAARARQWLQASDGSWSLQPVTGYIYSGSCNQPDFTLIPQYGLNPNIEYTGIRSRPTQLFDVNLSKLFSVTERVKFQLRVNAFNVLNHPQFGTVPFEYDTGATDPTFGTYSKLAGNNPTRNLELALKLIW